VIRAAVVLAASALALAACGSATPAAPKASQCPATAKAMKKIDADLAALRAAYKLPVKNTLFGNKAINVATDRFLNDVALAPIGNLKRNRLIDHAAGTLAGACEQCFQALEAARPIVNIRLGEKRC